MHCYSPWGPQPLRIDRAAQADVDASDCAFVIPFLPFDIEPLGSSCRETGLVAIPDGHRDSGRKQPCPTRDGSDPTRNGA